MGAFTNLEGYQKMKPTLENIKTIVTPELAQEFANQKDKFLFCLYTLQAKGFNLPSLHSRGAITTENACETLQDMLGAQVSIHNIKSILGDKDCTQEKPSNPLEGKSSLSDPWDHIYFMEGLARDMNSDAPLTAQDIRILINHTKEALREVFKLNQQLARESQKLSKERKQHKQAKETLQAILEASQEGLKN
jgi:hypothetical protein